MREHAPAAELDEANAMTRLGQCQIDAAEPRAASRSLRSAIKLHREEGNWSGEARAALQWTRLYAPGDRKMGILSDALSAPGRRSEELETELLARKAMYMPAGTERDAIAEQAIARLGPGSSTRLRGDLEMFKGDLHAAKWELKECQPFYERAHALFDAAGVYTNAVDALNRFSSAILLEGDANEGARQGARALEYARRRRIKLWHEIQLGDEAAVAILLGDLERARHALDLATPGISFTYHSGQIAIAEFTGETSALADLLPDPKLGGGSPIELPIRVLRARALYLLGDVNAAKEELDAVPPFVEREHAAALNSPAHSHGSFDTVLAAAGSPEVVRLVRDHLRAPQLRALIWCSADRLIGELSLRLGDVEDADAEIRRGLAWCEHQGLEVEAARCRAALAQVLEHKGESKQAGELANAARKTFLDCRATGYLERMQ